MKKKLYIEIKGIFQVVIGKLYKIIDMGSSLFCKVRMRTKNKNKNKLYVLKK